MGSNNDCTNLRTVNFVEYLKLLTAFDFRLLIIFHLLDFLAQNKVHVIESLPCYSADNVDTQRGSGTFDGSISALLALNEAGYVRNRSDLLLDLVNNPLGAFLPPPQASLEEKYKRSLKRKFRHGLQFSFHDDKKSNASLTPNPFA